jgi:protein SCO1/2
MSVMPARARLGLMAFATVVLIGALIVVLVPRSSSGPEARADGFEGSKASPAPPRDFSLRDQDGQLASLAQYRGRPVVLTFMYSTCRDTCPVTAQQIKGALREVHSTVPVLVVSVDPANDTPTNAKRFLLKQGLTGKMRFLLGATAQLAPIWDAYGIQPQGKGFEHTAYVLLIDRTGRQRVSWPADQLQPEPLARDLQRLGA